MYEPDVQGSFALGVLIKILKVENLNSGGLYRGER